MSKPSAHELKLTMQEDRKRLVAEQAEHFRAIEQIEPQLAMLNAYLGIKHEGLVLAAEIPVQVQPPAATIKRKYTRKPREQKTQDAPPLETHYCSDCKKNVEVDIYVVKGQTVTKCRKCGGLQVELLK